MFMVLLIIIKKMQKKLHQKLTTRLNKKTFFLYYKQWIKLLMKLMNYLKTLMLKKVLKLLMLKNMLIDFQLIILLSFL